MMDLKKTIIYSPVIWAQSQVHVTSSRYDPRKKIVHSCQSGWYGCFYPWLNPTPMAKRDKHRTLAEKQLMN